MSERLEQWKAREKIRSHVGWMSVWVGFVGLFVIATSIGVVVGAAGARGNAWVGLPMGGALLACARGLWNAKSWARWAVVSISGIVVLGELSALVRAEQIDLLFPFFLFALVYLLLPSTSKSFARAQGAQMTAPDRATTSH